jgi:carbon-monoxide dehydrogenase medium subunit
VIAFEYVRPKSLDEAVNLLDRHGAGAKLLAGGTDLLVRVRSGHTRPAVVVDLKRTEGIDDSIVLAGGVLRIGARAVMTDIAADAHVRRHFPALVEAARVVGSVQIRNRATLAGNMCNASPAADTAPALLVYGAAVNVAGRAGSRRVPLSEFFTGPGRTVLGRGEIVTSIDVPVPERPVGASFARLTRRRGVDLASLIVSCAIAADGDIRIALGAVAPTPIVVSERLERLDAVNGNVPELDALVQRTVARTSPISDVRAGRDYRAAMTTVHITRALRAAVERLTTGRGKA